MGDFEAIIPADVGPVEDYYLPEDASAESVFDVWERGEAVGNSITPSTFDADYRSWMGALLHAQLGTPGERTLVSVGCGNAMIESDLVRRGHQVIAVDVLEKAVSLAVAKGVWAVQADVMTWNPPTDASIVVYADGLLGHLHAPSDERLAVMDVFARWVAKRPGSSLVVSNDESRGEQPIEEADGVPDFYWYSQDYLREQAERAGFAHVDVSRYTYNRPLSGPRNRVVLSAKV